MDEAIRRGEGRKKGVWTRAVGLSIWSEKRTSDFSKLPVLLLTQILGDLF
jgi:hypothetical protein